MERTPTREDDFDHEFAHALFEDCMAAYDRGELSYKDAIERYRLGVLGDIDLHEKAPE